MENKRYNFLINNHVYFGNMISTDESKKNLTQIPDFDYLISNFYENSRESMNDFINQVNNTKSEKSIVFISEKPFPMLARQSLVMKNRGFKTFLINMGQISSNDQLLIKDSFNNIIQNVCSFLKL